MRNRKLAIAAVSRILPWVGTCLAILSSSQLHAADRVRDSLSALSLANGPIWVAEEKEVFKKYELDPEVILVDGGATRSVAALLA